MKKPGSIRLVGYAVLTFRSLMVRLQQPTPDAK
jgi:hypothetical protein